MIIAVWAIIIIFRPDLRKIMIWGGFIYWATITAIYFFYIISLNFVDVGGSITPGYWNPKTLFDLGQKTRGYAIEDVVFMFFVGGIGTSVYELFFAKKVQYIKKHRHHLSAIIVGMIVAALFAVIFRYNLIYSLVIFGFASALIIWIQRKDLIRHSIFGGFSFLLIYFCIFLVFNYFFPNFIKDFYNLKNLTGIIILGVPVEELLYALSFGMFWAPIYEYERGSK